MKHLTDVSFFEDLIFCTSSGVRIQMLHLLNVREDLLTCVQAGKWYQSADGI